ncbi:MAG TPA: hypothetical protein VG101_06985 [Puia sp.]|jgi:hypothetical protein|nr:hypothetical protein [Puia sp.]
MENKLGVWDLIATNKFEEACLQADMDYKANENIFTLRNKVYALFHLKKYVEAAELISYIREMTKNQTDSDAIFLGIAYWFLNEKEKSVKIWKEGIGSKYTDAAGGVELQIILYFSSISLQDIKLKEQSAKAIQKIVKAKRAVNWPGPLGAYVIGRISEEELFSKVSTIDFLKERNLSQAHFVKAVRCLELGEIKPYESELRKSVDIGPRSYVEQMYYLAEAELGSFLR